MVHGLQYRREQVRKRLEEQLVTKLKPVKKKPGEFKDITENDVKRIKAEIKILEGPILKYRKKNRKYDKKGMLLKD